MFASNGQSLGYIKTANVRTVVPEQRLPQILRDATVSIEDRRFYQHGALDYEGIVRAAIKRPVQRRERAAGRLDADAAAGRESPTRRSRLTVTPQVQDHPGQARRAAGQAPQQGLDPQQLSERRRLRDRRRADRVRRRGRVGDVLRQAGVEDQPGAGGAARRPAAGAVRIQPVRRAQAAPATAATRCSRRWSPPHYITQAQADRRQSHARLQTHENDVYTTRQQPYVFDYVQQQAEQDLCPDTPNNCPTLTAGRAEDLHDDRPAQARR